MKENSKENEEVEKILKEKFQKLEDVFKNGYGSALKKQGEENFSFSKSFGKNSSKLSSKNEIKEEEVHRVGISSEFLASQDFEIFRHFSVYQKL